MTLTFHCPMCNAWLEEESRGVVDPDLCGICEDPANREPACEHCGGEVPDDERFCGNDCEISYWRERVEVLEVALRVVFGLTCGFREGVVVSDYDADCLTTARRHALAVLTANEATS